MEFCSTSNTAGSQRSAATVSGVIEPEKPRMAAFQTYWTLIEYMACRRVMVASTSVPGLNSTIHPGAGSGLSESGAGLAHGGVTTPSGCWTARARDLPWNASAATVRDGIGSVGEFK